MRRLRNEGGQCVTIVPIEQIIYLDIRLANDDRGLWRGQRRTQLLQLIHGLTQSMTRRMPVTLRPQELQQVGTRTGCPALLVSSNSTANSTSDSGVTWCSPTSNTHCPNACSRIIRTPGLRERA